MVPRLPHSLRVERTILTILIIRTLRDMLRVAMDPIMDAGIALIIAIAVFMVRDTGVCLAVYLFLVDCPNLNAEAPSQSRCGFNRWSIIFPSQGVPERKHVMGMINHFDTTHVAEGQPYKKYNYPEFRKKIIRIFRTSDLTHVNIIEFMSAQQKQDESVLDYMGRVHDNVAKAFPKVVTRIGNTMRFRCSAQA